MMDKYKYITLSMLVLCLAAGCGGGAVSTADIPAINAEVAIDNTKTFDLTEIADSIEFIALDDSRQEGLIGAIPSFAESRNAWYVRDGSRPVKIFDKTGKFLSTSGMTGRGPDEFLRILDFAVDWENDILYIAEGSMSPREKRKIFAYDSDGRILARNDLTTSLRVSFFDDKLIVLRTRHEADPNYPERGKGVLLDIFSPDMKHTGSVEATDNGAYRFFYPNGDIKLFLGDGISNNGKSLLVNMSRNDTLFHLKNDALEPAFVFDFGRYAIPVEAFSKNSTVSREDLYFLSSIWESDRYLIVRATGINSSHLLVFDRTEGVDGLSAVGPNGERGLFVGGIAFIPSYIRDNRLVGYIQAFNIVDNVDAITNPDLKALATTLKEDSNPVIVVAKLKK
jgi:hypothetical protein